MMLTLTAFWLTLVTLIKASMVVFGAGLAIIIFAGILLTLLCALVSGLASRGAATN